VIDAQVVEPTGPAVEVGSPGYAPRDVVESRAPLVEVTAVMPLMMMETDQQAGTPVEQQNRIATVLVPVMWSSFR
jgi:hypothetical protein